MHRLDQLSVDDLFTCSQVFREVAAGAETMEDAAQGVTDYLHRNLLDADGAPAAPLVRLYKTHRFRDLEPGLQEFAEQAAAAEELRPETRCLTLLGTSGTEADWNDRRSSRGHRAIPLTSTDVVSRSPMIAALITQLGVDIGTVVAPGDAMTIELHHRAYDLFFVPDAEGSPMVPAQEGFVRPYGIHSVVGSGGMLPSGDLFALILFTTQRLDEGTADLFRTMALSVKATIVKFTFKVFEDPR